MGQFVRVDRRYNQPFRLTGRGCLVVFGWVGLLVLAPVPASLLPLSQAIRGFLGLLSILAVIGLAVWRSMVRSRRRTAARALASAARLPPPAPVIPQRPMLFNPPPGWPSPPAGWLPGPDWQPDPSWPAMPPGWQLWIPDLSAPIGERNSRSIPQDVKIAVAARDGGRCRQCGSTADLHFDHVIPWSKGGANTVANIQLLCGTCNRRKGADDIPASL
jgi:hypothetical protein